jgi:hypothetical protein
VRVSESTSHNEHRRNSNSRWQREAQHRPTTFRQRHRFILHGVTLFQLPWRLPLEQRQREMTRMTSKRLSLSPGCDRKARLKR